MRKSIVLIVLVLLNFAGFSQNSEDSLTCIPNSQLRRAAQLIEAGRRDSMLLKVSNKYIAGLERIVASDSVVIAEYVALDSMNQELIVIKDKKYDVLQEKYNLANKTAEKQNRKLRFNKGMGKVFMITTAVATGYILLK